MNLAKAFSNNDVVLLVWTYEQPIRDCLGFAISRRDTQTGNVTVLESKVGFVGNAPAAGNGFNPTTKWPIQKFNWRDFSATSGSTYDYTITPMIGAPGNLQPGNQVLTTNIVTLSPGTGAFRAYFNRGILSTQSISMQIPKSSSGIPNYRILLDRLRQPGDKLRNRLADELRPAVMSLLDKAITEGGTCYCALYELSDTELVSKLLAAKGKVHIILSNTGSDDATNEVARASLHDSGIDIIDRFVPSGHIGHNKFVVYCDRNGNAQTVLTGSTNWTPTGLCAQSNNALLIDSAELAEHYMDYWKALKTDKAEQSSKFRKANNSPRKAQVDGSDVTLWFSPNTQAKNKTANSPIPSDMQEVFGLMQAAKKSILFLAFQPGTPSIINQAADIQIDKPDLFIRGAATDLNAVEQSNVTLFHRGINDPVIVGAQELKDDFAFWMAELLKSSPNAHAIIHDKILVLDAFTDDYVVITGSHNQGYRASYNNDENMLIIKGNIELAISYATHILDVYDHYRWRYFLSKNTRGRNRFAGLNRLPSWQEPYFNDKRGESIDRRFWI
jgi:phosphatidylserine/phosphatidylglycerophosphate/cardiolipin synthase-like enzyme